MTHAELVVRAKRWLKNNGGSSIVLTELVTMSNETADAIGFNHYHSTLVECKTSRADFRADAKKFFRRYPESGKGDFRYYMTPPGLLSIEELPDKWGLAEVDGKRIRIRRKAEFIGGNLREERTLLVSVLRRLK